MSDMAECYFNAWVLVMGEGPSHLFCAWHVDRAWQKNLNKIADKEKRSEIYKILKILQQETSSTNFITALNNATSYMCNDQSSKNFGEYFKNTYSQNFRKWAYCFRTDSSINTNMHVEAMHKVIKYLYLERKTVQRLDKGLHVMLKYVRDKSVERLIRLTKGENTKLTRELTQAHKSAIKSCEKYNLLHFNTQRNHWKITKNEHVSYDVAKIFDNKCCKQVCIFCEACIHMYSCECKFYKETKKICKHIHFINWHLKLLGDSPDNHSKLENYANDELIEGLSALSQEQETCTGNRSKLKEKIELLVTKLSFIKYEELDESIISEIHHHLLVINNLTDCPQLTTNNKFEFKNQSSKRVICPQVRFVSTKKQRVTRTTPSRATPQEGREIQEDLRHSLDDSFLAISSFPSNDHQYV